MTDLRSLPRASQTGVSDSISLVDGFAQHGHRNLEWSSLESHSIVFQGLAGLFGLRCGEWEGWDARQKLHYPTGCACAWAAGHSSNDDPGQSWTLPRRWRPDFRWRDGGWWGSVPLLEWRPESRPGAVSRVAIRDQIRKEGNENWTLLCAFEQALRLAVRSSGSAPALLPSGALVLCLLHVGSRGS